MIECGIREAKKIHDEGKIQCNYVFIEPASIEELSTRIIRKNLPGMTKHALTTLQNESKKEIEEAKRLKFINKIILNDKQDDFMKKAVLYIVF